MCFDREMNSADDVACASGTLPKLGRQPLVVEGFAHASDQRSVQVVRTLLVDPTNFGVNRLAIASLTSTRSELSGTRQNPPCLSVGTIA